MKTKFYLKDIIDIYHIKHLNQKFMIKRENIKKNYVASSLTTG